MPVIAGRKSKLESFAGANITYTIEAMMSDKKALQVMMEAHRRTHSAASHWEHMEWLDSRPAADGLVALACIQQAMCCKPYINHSSHVHPVTCQLLQTVLMVFMPCVCTLRLCHGASHEGFTWRCEILNT